MSKPITVSDSRSSSNDQIVFAAEAIGRSPLRRKVFEAIFKGKKKFKTVSEIVDETGMNRKQVLVEAKKLEKKNIVKQVKSTSGEIGYEKDAFYQEFKGKILTLAGNKKKREDFPTKVRPKVKVTLNSRTTSPRRLISTKQITIDDLKAFSRIKNVKFRQIRKVVPIDEASFKAGIQKIIGEAGKFQDWGGEINDLFTTRVTFNGRRKPTAFAFKGKGKKVKKLTPKDMGKNGDQIQRLFRSSAEIFLIQYWGQIDESVIEQMAAFATKKSLSTGETIYFGLIDGVDSQRIIKAYPKVFKEI